MNRDIVKRLYEYVEAENGNNPSAEGFDLLSVLGGEINKGQAYSGRERVHCLKTWRKPFDRIYEVQKSFPR